MLLICLFFAILILGGVFCFYWENNTQNKARAVIEDSSVIHLFRDKLDSETTDLEVEEMFKDQGRPSGGYTPFLRRFFARNYTLMGYRGDTLLFFFRNEDGKVGKLYGTCWEYDKGDEQLYACFLQYLTGMLGKPVSHKTDGNTETAEWYGCRLLRTQKRIGFYRIMD